MFDNLPSLWRKVTLRDTLDSIKNGTTQRQNQDQLGLPVTRIETISEGIIDPERVGWVELYDQDFSEYEIEPGDILFSHINSLERIGNCAIYEGTPPRLLHGMNLLRLRCNKGIIDPYFLLYYFRFPPALYDIRSRAGQAVNQASVNQTNLQTIPIPLPPLPEQRRIVTILRKADELRQLRRQANQRAEDLPNAIMSNLFGEFSQYPKKSLDSLCGFITKGTTPDSSQLRNQFGLDGIPFLKVLHITDDGEIDFDKEPTFVSSQLHNTALSRSKVFPGDIIINIVGPPLGRIGMVPSTYSEWNVNQALAILRPNPGVSSVYLFHILRHPLILPYLLKQAVGVRQLNLSLTQVRNFEVPMPDLVSQKTFDKHLRQITLFKENQKYRDQSGIDLENLFHSLISRAFTGELTETWRDTYSVELTKAAAERDRLLGLAKQVITGNANITFEPVTLVATATIKPSRAVFDELDTSTQTLLTAAQTRTAYFRSEDLIANHELTAVQAEAGLHVLAALGFVRQVALEGQLVYRTVDGVQESAEKPAILTQ